MLRAPQREHVRLHVNGRRYDVAGNDALVTLADFLRRRGRMTGTKIVCAEGDCGACTVLLGQAQEGRLRYRTVDACICFVFQLDGCHVVTIEGLEDDQRLHAVQEAMVRCHGSQCGYCTPGLVMAMAGLLEQVSHPTEAQWRRGLTGNLCRCTGYSSILAAGNEAADQRPARLIERYDERPMLEDYAAVADEPLMVVGQIDDSQHQVFSPTRLEEALSFLAAHPESVVMAGGTDLGVRINVERRLPRRLLDLSRIASLRAIENSADGCYLGATACWTDVAQAIGARFPTLDGILDVFGSPQIRNLGTVGGNIANASPIADSLPWLLVCEAELELRSHSNQRVVNINNFFRGYKQIDLRPGELITRVYVPVPPSVQALRLYKVSRRRDLDIATLTAAVMISLDGDMIAEAAIALGGVGETVIRARQAEYFLRGRTFQLSTLEEAGEVAATEVSAIDDVRGSRDYRLQLTRNVLIKYFHDCVIPCQL